MKILSADQIRQWDQFTIEQEPITSLQLMERASSKCTDWLTEHYPVDVHFHIFCGKGNNGGDGLAIARQLLNKDYRVTVYILEFGYKGTADFQANLSRLHTLNNADIHFIQSKEHFHTIPTEEIIIDAIFGSGLNRKLEGFAAELVDFINNTGCEIVSIDIPTGLFTDHSSVKNSVIHASHTLTFQCYKLAFLMAENEKATGNIHVLNIGLSPRFYEGITSDHVGTDEEYLRSIYQPRKRFSHKGHYGHSLIVAGSHGKMGAAILCAKACLRSGSGLVSCHIPAAGYYAIQVAVPEVMVNVDIDKTLITNISEDLALYEAIGVGPGIGTAIETKEALLHLFSNVKNSVVADADALNLMAMYPELFNKIPRGSVLTPHPKEFERLFGITGNDFERMSLARKKATENNIIIVLKGHHTLIALPDGKVYFNTTGNAGMATAGSGDVLTGIITGLIAQGYSSANAAVLGVYLHGMAADLSLESQSKESLIAGDIIDNLGKAFKQIDLAI